jgi:hypothetical protein
VPEAVTRAAYRLYRKAKTVNGWRHDLTRLGDIAVEYAPYDVTGRPGSCTSWPSIRSTSTLTCTGYFSC